ncbi:MAG: hypothetical protein NVSMB47_02610 [Polyangiales bacterium]
MRRSALLTALPFAFAAAALAAPARADSWTVMVYMEANNSLEPFANETFSELLSVGKKKGLTILVELDVGKHKSTHQIDGMPEGNGIKRLVVHKDRVESEDDDVHTDMTTAKGLGDFITYGRKKHPADRYAVLLWDHGAGWHGCCESETPEPRGMSLAAIASGLERGIKGSEDAIDLVAFDECLMSELEVASAIAPFTSVMVGSEELEPGEGMDYHGWLTALGDDPSMTAEQVGKSIAKSYVDHVESQSGNPGYTLSVLNLAHLDDLTAATGRLGKQLTKMAEDPDRWPEVGAARAKADSFGGEEASIFGVVDLAQFARGAAKIEGASAADDVLAAIDKIVTFKVSGPMHRKSKGISVYLPENQLDQDYADAAFSDKWTKFARTYAESAGQDTTPPDTDGISISQLPDDNGGGGGQTGKRSTLELAGLSKTKDLAEVSLVLAEDVSKDEHLFLGEVPLRDAEQLAEQTDKDKINVDWNGEWPMIGDGTKVQMAPLFAVKQYEEDGGAKMAIVEMPAELDDGTGAGFAKKVRVQFAIDLVKHAGKLIGAFEIAKGGAGAIKLGPAMKVRPFRVLVADKGKYTMNPGTDVLGGALQMLSQKLPDKKYMVGLHLVDFAGNASTKLVDVSQLLSDAAKQSQQQGAKKSGCARKCSLGRDADGDATPWIGAVVVAGAIVARRRRRSPSS